MPAIYTVMGSGSRLVLSTSPAVNNHPAPLTPPMSGTRERTQETLHDINGELDFKPGYVRLQSCF